MKRASILLLLVLLLVSPVQEAWAHRLVTVAFPVFAPYRTMNNGQPSGLVVALLNDVGKRMGVTFKFEEVTFHRAMYMLESGEVDIMPGLFRRKDREEKFLYVETPYRFERVRFLVLKDGPKVHTYEDLQELTIGTLEGVQYFNEFDTDTTLIKRPVLSDDLNVKKLLERRIDCFVLAGEVAKEKIAMDMVNDKIIQAPFLPRKKDGVHLVFSRRSPNKDLAEGINETLATMEREGTLDALYRQYFQ